MTERKWSVHTSMTDEELERFLDAPDRMIPLRDPPENPPEATRLLSLHDVIYELLEHRRQEAALQSVLRRLRLGSR